MHSYTLFLQPNCIINSIYLSPISYQKILFAVGMSVLSSISTSFSFFFYQLWVTRSPAVTAFRVFVIEFFFYESVPNFPVCLSTPSLATFTPTDFRYCSPSPWCKVRSGSVTLPPVIKIIIIMCEKLQPYVREYAAICTSMHSSMCVCV